MKLGGFTQGWTAAEREANRAQQKISAEAKKRAKETQDEWKAAGEKIGGYLSAGITALAGGAAYQKFITETINAQNEQALLAAALKATGEQAGFSQKRLNEMAGALEGTTIFSAGEFNQAQTVLLGFTNIVGDQLPAALQRTADFAARTGVSMKSAAETIGRALDIPSVGMVSLQRQGFKFAESQIEAAKRLEETGRIAEAQKIVLDSLDETYGGAAAAARDTLGGAMIALKNTFNSLMTGEGGSVDALKGAVNDLATTISSESVRSAFQSLLTWAAETASTVFKAATQIVEAGELIKNSSIWGWLQVSGDDSRNLGDAITETEGKIKRLQETVTSMSRPLHSWWNADDIVIANGQISTLQAKLKSLYAMRDQQAKKEAAPAAPTVLGPDLTPRKIGKVKLDDVDKPKGGKSQAEKDYEHAEKYLAALKAQADGRKTLTAYERLSYDLAVGKVKMTEKQKALAEGQATALDMAKEAELQRADAVSRNTALYEAQERALSKSSEYAALLSMYGKGDKENAVLRERVNLIQAQQQELRKMEQDQANALLAAKTEDDLDNLKRRYAERLEIIRGAQAEELRMFDEFQAQKKEMDGSWMLGAQSAIATYNEKTQDAYANARDATTSMMQTIEGAFVSLFTLGESSFKSFVASILKGIAQIAAQQAASGIAGFLGSALTSLIGGGLGSAGAGVSASSIANTGISFGGFRAAGGPVGAGSLYRVNELGPELLSYGGSDYLMMGGSGGYVKPLGAADTEKRGAGNITIVNQTTGRVDKVEQRQLTREEVVLIIQEQTPGIMVSQTQNASSPFSRTMQSSFNTSRRR